MCGLMMLGLAHSKLFIKSPRITLRSSRPPSSLGREPTRREKLKYVFSRARKKGGEKIVWVFGARGKKLFYIPLPFSGRHFKRIVAKKSCPNTPNSSLYICQDRFLLLRGLGDEGTRSHVWHSGFELSLGYFPPALPRNAPFPKK